MDYLLGFLNVVIVILTLFLIGIILIQRGKGGGLAGAFGGMGGSSAFGTRTGDVFTKITVGVAIAWILLSMLMVVLTNRRQSSAWGDSPTSVTKGSESPLGRSKAKTKLSDADVPPPDPVPVPAAVPDGLPRPLPDMPDFPLTGGSPTPTPKK